jgi:hypothetical protein
MDLCVRRDGPRAVGQEGRARSASPRRSATSSPTWPAASRTRCCWSCPTKKTAARSSASGSSRCSRTRRSGRAVHRLDARQEAHRRHAEQRLRPAARLVGLAVVAGVGPDPPPSSWTRSTSSRVRRRRGLAGRPGPRPHPHLRRAGAGRRDLDADDVAGADLRRVRRLPDPAPLLRALPALRRVPAAGLRPAEVGEVQGAARRQEPARPGSGRARPPGTSARGARGASSRPTSGRCFGRLLRHRGRLLEALLRRPRGGAASPRATRSGSTTRA